MIALLKKIQDFFIVYFDIFFNRLKSFFSQRQNRIILWLILLLFLLIIFTLVMMIKTPVIVFLDENNTKTSGTVYLNNRQLGYTEGIFADMPKIFCLKKHKLYLKKEDYKLVWETSPLDCGPRQLKLTYDTAIIKKEDSVTLRFVIEETNQILSGTLYIDNNLIENITGQYLIKIDKCKEIKDLMLVISQNTTLAWSHNPEWCDVTEEIKYKASLDMVG